MGEVCEEDLSLWCDCYAAYLSVGSLVEFFYDLGLGVRDDCYEYEGK